MFLSVWDINNVVGPQGTANNELDNVKNKIAFWIVDIGSNVQMDILVFYKRVDTCCYERTGIEGLLDRLYSFSVNLINVRRIIQMYDIKPVSGLCYVIDGVCLDHFPLVELIIFLRILRDVLIPLY